MANLTKSKSMRWLSEQMVSVYRPIQATTEVFGGAAVSLDSDGRAGVLTAGERFDGFCFKDIDNSAGAAGAAGYDVPIVHWGIPLLAVSGATIADIGKAVFCSVDDNHFSFVPVAGWYVGRVVLVPTTGYAYVEMNNPGSDTWETWTSLADDVTFALPAQEGYVEVVGGGEMLHAHVTAAGTVTGTVSKRMAATVTLVDAQAASTTGQATQHDLTTLVGGAGVMIGIVDPDVPRNIVINHTDGDASISAFTVTVVGIDVNGDAATEVFTFAGGLDQVGSVAWATVTSITMSGYVGHAAADTLDIGYGVKYGVPVPDGASALDFDHLAVAHVEEVPAAEDATYGTFTPTTAADGTKDITVTYSYLLSFNFVTTNCAFTDSDTNLCVYDAGANATVKNRLGATKLVRIKWTGINAA